ncbi:MAG: hypothetical protein CFH21_00913 [Alphaproteobacteria bacterium MarineAlpha5_Bin11]|nr:MAG: hypothetical protein CFH21_00913 [Alphaproteobacteria bacterium MarineAlpha5_Bin11]
MEELTQPYCLKILKNKLFTFSIIFIFILFIILKKYNIFIRNNVKSGFILDIPKNSNLSSIANILENNNITYSKFFPFFTAKFLNYDKKLSYGEYLINENDTLFDILIKIKNGDVYERKFILIEGFEYYHLNNLLESTNMSINHRDFKNYNIVADTFSYSKYQSTDSFLQGINNFTEDLFSDYLNSDILKEFTMKEIIIISSLVEKEANNDDDRKMISSVIYNRLRKGMKLDIDATVIFSITKGMYKFDRSLNYEDLKIPSEYNTYLNKGLPPYPISFPGTQTIKIVLEDHDSPYYFYFFDTNKNSHIFSKDYKEHLTKLNEYRSR